MSMQQLSDSPTMPMDLSGKGWKLLEFKSKPLPWQAVNPVLDLYGEPHALPDMAIDEATSLQVERDEADAIREEASEMTAPASAEVTIGNVASEAEPVIPDDLSAAGWVLDKVVDPHTQWQLVNDQLDLQTNWYRKVASALEEARLFKPEVAPIAPTAIEADAVIEEAKASPAAERTEELSREYLPEDFFSSPQMLNVGHLRTDGGTQPRESLNMLTVNEYKEAMTAGDVFPPVEVFYDGMDLWLADGFHRHRATVEADIEEILANVRRGTQREALLFSLGANATHGLQRSREDKRRSVLTLLNDAEWAEWSDREIAKHANVSHTFVAHVRRELHGENESDASATATGNVGTATADVDPPATAGGSDPQSSISEIAGAVDQESDEGDEPKQEPESEGAQAQAIARANESDWQPAEFVAVLERHNGVLYKRQLEEMGCTLGGILHALEVGAIKQPETGKFTLPDHKEQPSGDAKEQKPKSTTPAANGDNLLGKTPVEELLKGRMLTVSFTWLPALKGKVSVSVNAGGKPQDASRASLVSENVRGFSPPVLALIREQLAKPASPKVVKRTASAPAKKAAKKVAKKAAKKSAARKRR